MPEQTSPAAVVKPADGSAVASMTYEQAREELLDVVRRLETGAATLEESLGLWERGEALADVCQRWLDGARARLDAAGSAGPAAPAAQG